MGGMKRGHVGGPGGAGRTQDKEATASGLCEGRDGGRGLVRSAVSESGCPGPRDWLGTGVRGGGGEKAVMELLPTCLSGGTVGEVNPLRRHQRKKRIERELLKLVEFEGPREHFGGMTRKAA